MFFFFARIKVPKSWTWKWYPRWSRFERFLFEWNSLACVCVLTRQSVRVHDACLPVESVLVLAWKYVQLIKLFFPWQCPPVKWTIRLDVYAFHDDFWSSVGNPFFTPLLTDYKFCALQGNPIACLGSGFVFAWPFDHSVFYLCVFCLVELMCTWEYVISFPLRVGSINHTSQAKFMATVDDNKPTSSKCTRLFDVVQS